MNLTSLFERFIPSWGSRSHGKDAHEGKSELQQNMEKALHMKQEAGPQTTIPEHRTSHDGMQPHDTNDIAPSGAFEYEGNTPQLKRSHGVRRGDKG